MSTPPPTASTLPEGRLPEAGSQPLPGAKAALALLICINLFNYIDRQVLAAVEPSVCQSLLLSHDANDPNARAKMGLLSTAFLITYMLMAPVFGVLAERWSRWKLIAIGVALWSLASGAGGLATVFMAMLLTRCFVGVGEAVYGPVAPTLLSDFFPVKDRGKILSWFYLAIPVGGALGYALGDLMRAINPAQETWRWAFFVVVIPGLLLGVWAWLMPEPKRGASENLGQPTRRREFRDYLIFLRTPSYVLDTLGMTAMTFTMGALAWWMPRYLEIQHVQPLWGIQPVTFFGITTAVAGLLGTIAGGIVGDKLRSRFSGSYFLVSGTGLLLTVPCILLFMYVPFNTAWVFVFLAEFFLFFNTGPSNAILANVTHPSIRSSGFALNILVIHTLGDAISPPILGAITDYAVAHGVQSEHSMDAGFLVVTSLLLVGGILWLWGARYLARDTAAAPHRLD